MGANGSSFPSECPPFFASHATDEFERVLGLKGQQIFVKDGGGAIDAAAAQTVAVPGADSGRELTLNEVLNFRCPNSVKVSFRHVGTLFALDGNRDGTVSKEELLQFVHIYYRNYRELSEGYWQDMCVQMEGYYTYELLRFLKTGGGERKTVEAPVAEEGAPGDVAKVVETAGVPKFVEWVIALLKPVVPEGFQTFPSQPGVEFLHSDALHALYSLLDLRTSYNIDFQGFLDLVQRAGEDEGVMNLDNAEFDDVAPLNVVKHFVRDFATSMLRMTDELSLVE
jgi:hypothetical protein